MLPKIYTRVVDHQLLHFLRCEEEEDILEWDEEDTQQFPSSEFPRLKTLILSRLNDVSLFDILLIIRASNLTELGLDDGLYSLDESVAQACEVYESFKLIPGSASETR